MLFRSSLLFAHFLPLPPQELASLHAKLETTAVESVDIGHLLDSRLEAAIEELREKSELEIAQYKKEVEATYRDKVGQLVGKSLLLRCSNWVLNCCFGSVPL